MSITGLREFDHAVHTTNTWLKELQEELTWFDRHRTYHAMRAVLHTLRDRLPGREAVHLSAQLPMLVRGFYFDGWRFTHTSPPEESAAEFLGHIRDAFEFDTDANPKQIVQAVFRVLGNHICEAEIAKVRALLPSEIQELWD